MTNSISTDVAFGGVWCSRVVVKPGDSHSIDPADKTNKRIKIHPTALVILWVIRQMSGGQSDPTQWK